jgi:hypothetical protein
MSARLQRAIGVIYRPETELASHYFDARLPEQFDGYVWFEETTAIKPLPTEPQADFPKPIHSDCEPAVPLRAKGRTIGLVDEALGCQLIGRTPRTINCRA